MSRVLLVVPPFHFLDRPSLGVSLLKAALVRDGIPCDVLYLNLRFARRIGTELYLSVTEGRYQAMLGEWLFAADLFGERAPDPATYLEEVLLGQDTDRAFAERVLALRADVPAFLDEVMEQVDWEAYALVGVTSTFQQNCPSLALLRRVKARHPHIITAMGGANCEGQMGAALHDLFPFLDYVCSGEGDRVFPRLVRAVVAGERVGPLPGLYARGELNLLGDANRAPSVTSLDTLPHPDFDDYFAELAASGLDAELAPILVFETARGCWWGEKHHCTFCGLNGEGMEYRSKGAERARDELDYLVDRHANRMVHVVDNILDFRYFESLLEELAGRTFPPNFYYMTKANLTKDQVRLLARAGARDITPGIESLSTPILRLMDKGVSALQNIRLLKWCAEIGVVPNWALLCGFPDEDPAEYAQMAELVPSLTHLQPPGGFNTIRLDRFSPNFDEAAARGFVNVRPAVPYEHVYPFERRDLMRLVWHFDFDYADRRDPHAYVAGLRAAVDGWRAQHAASRLELRDDGERLVLEDTRPVAARAVTELRGATRLAYLALDAGSTAQAVHAELRRVLSDAAPTAEQVQGWLDDWLAERLVLREGSRYLSLAVNPAERIRLPAERIAAFLKGTAVAAASGALDRAPVTEMPYSGA